MKLKSLKQNNCLNFGVNVLTVNVYQFPQCLPRKLHKYNRSLVLPTEIIDYIVGNILQNVDTSRFGDRVQIVDTARVFDLHRDLKKTIVNFTWIACDLELKCLTEIQLTISEP